MHVGLNRGKKGVSKRHNCFVNSFCRLSYKLRPVFTRQKKSPQFNAEKVPTTKNVSNHSSSCASDGSNERKNDKARNNTIQSTFKEQVAKRTNGHYED